MSTCIARLVLCTAGYEAHEFFVLEGRAEWESATPHLSTRAELLAAKAYEHYGKFYPSSVYFGVVGRGEPGKRESSICMIRTDTGEIDSIVISPPKRGAKVLETMTTFIKEKLEEQVSTSSH
jgi:hypothetical protein